MTKLKNVLMLLVILEAGQNDLGRCAMWAKIPLWELRLIGKLETLNCFKATKEFYLCARNNFLFVYFLQASPFSWSKTSGCRQFVHLDQDTNKPMPSRLENLESPWLGGRVATWFPLFNHFVPTSEQCCQYFVLFHTDQPFPSPSTSLV